MKLYNSILLKAIPVLILGMVFSCKNSIEEIDAIIDPQTLPVQTSFNSEYIFSERGKIKNKLVASKLERFESEEDVRIEVNEGFEFFTYDSLEQVSSKLSAKKGVYYENLLKFVANDSVELSNVNNEMMFTEELTWLQETDKIFTNKLVKIVTDDGTLWADSLVSNSAFSNYQLLGPRGELNIKEEE